MASRAIALGEARIIVAGGMENMTRAPFLLEKGRQGYRLGHGELTDSLIKDGLWDVQTNFTWATPENGAAAYRFSRQEVDDFALESYRRAREAITSGSFTRDCPGRGAPEKGAPPASRTMRNRTGSISQGCGT